MPTTSLRGSQKAQDTLAFLRSKIRSGEWAVGDTIPKESELMELIGVGKSTVREAVRSLATLGMLQTIPGSGTFVRARNPVSSILSDFLAEHDLGEVLLYRRSLEIEAAQAAAIRRTEEQLEALRQSYQRSLNDTQNEVEVRNHVKGEGSFHRLIVEASGSRLMLDLYVSVMQALHTAAEQGKVYESITRETMLADHAALLQAIESQSVRDAAHVMALHADRDIGLSTETLDFSPRTERVDTLIEAGFETSDQR